MSGFQIPERTAILEFHGDYLGAEAEVLIDVTLGEFIDFMRIDDSIDSTIKSADEYEWFEETALRSWNIQDRKGNPIKIEKGCMMKIPRPLARAILQGWFKAVMGLPSPLEENSLSGEQSPESQTQLPESQ
jgi:hypothetical protein